MSARPAKFVSLFSGAGGFDLGLEQAGWKSIYASDLDAAAVKTLSVNQGAHLHPRFRAFEETIIEQSDIRQLTAKHILSSVGHVRGEIPLLAGGPPCQSWSSAGHQRGFEDPRGQLFDDFVRLADGLDVRWIILENVRGLLTARGGDGQPGSALTYIRQRLLRAGFQTTVSLANAADYGVPQRRVRLFMIGFRAGDPPEFPETTHEKVPDRGSTKHKTAWISLGQALQGIRSPSPDEIVRPTGKLAVELADIRAGSGVKSPGKPEKTRPNGHWGYKQGAFVADLTQSARTVTANAQQDWIREPDFGLRRLSPRECAAIQGFPPEWKFDGNRTLQYRLIGNAVSPPVARALGVSLRKHLQGEQNTKRLADIAKLMPLPDTLRNAITYTARDERANGESRKSSPNRRLGRTLSLAK